MNEPSSMNEPDSTNQPSSMNEPSSMNQPGSTAESTTLLTQSGTVPTPPPFEESRDLPQHSGATPTSPKAGPADTQPSTQLDFPEGSVETELVEHLKSPRGADEDMWFELDQVTFTTGKAKLQAASQQQLKNVADILKANPDVKIRVGGSTDTSGQTAANQRLAKARADAVAQALIAQGIDPERIDTDTSMQPREQTAARTHRRPAIQVTSRGDLAG